MIQKCNMESFVYIHESLLYSKSSVQGPRLVVVVVVVVESQKSKHIDVPVMTSLN